MMFNCVRVFKRFLEQTFPVLKWVIAFSMVLVLSGCVEEAVSQDLPMIQPKRTFTTPQISPSLVETSPPDVIQELRVALSAHQPQVKILSPQGDEVLHDNAIAVKLQVKDLSIFQDPEWRLGPHLNLILDNQPEISIYDLNQPLILSNISPGTHTLRVFAAQPWQESFKNEGAYAQTTFHIFTKTDDNNPDPRLPLLTYNLPQDSYGAEPILLDYYLTNAPLHTTASDNPDSKFSNWRIRSTVNGESFIFDRWQPVYLKGFKTGKNWVKLEFLDNQGNPVKNAFNTTIKLINYQPNGQDPLSKIIRKELTYAQVRGIVDQKYATSTTTVPQAEPTPTPEVKQEVQAPQTEVPQTPTSLPEPTPIPTPEVKQEVQAPPVPQPTPKTEVPQIPTSLPNEPPQVESLPELEPTPIKPPQVESLPQVEPTPLKPDINLL